VAEFQADPLQDALGDVPSGEPLRVSVTASVSADEVPDSSEAPASDRISGALVHRLLSLDPSASGVRDDESQLVFARDLLTPEERASAGDVESLVRGAVHTWRRLAGRPDVGHALASGERLHEVPFSFLEKADPPVILRGTIDCLVRRPDGSLLVLEFKTGRPHPSHERQLNLYVRALQAGHPDAAVDWMLVYA
jgi:PD-(D/E)XK nuclease superfamily protein